jgi:hypothetical protein
MAEDLAKALGGREATKSRRLRSLQSAVDREVGALEKAHREFLSGPLLDAYRLGAQQAAATLGHDVVWTQLHREAAQALAVTRWEEVLEATRFVKDDTKRTLRNLAKSAAERTILGEATASKAGRDLAEAARKEAGLLTLRYKNGARHAISDWADMSARTSSALAFNEGTFVQAAQDGIRWMECFDGLDCGLVQHGVPPFANGMVVSLAEAKANPIAHPRCARSWSPRPDAKGPSRSGRTPDAFEAAEAERARAAEFLVTGERRGKFSVARELQKAAPRRPPRAPRATRGERAPRTPRKEPAKTAPPKVGPQGKLVDEFTRISDEMHDEVRQAVDHAQEQMKKLHGYGDHKMNPAKRIEGEGIKRRLVDSPHPDRVPIQEFSDAPEGGRFLPSKANEPIHVEVRRLDSKYDLIGEGRMALPDPGTVVHELGHWADISMMTPEGETWASKAGWYIHRFEKRIAALERRALDPDAPGWEKRAAAQLRENSAESLAENIGTKGEEAMNAFARVYDAIADSPTYKKTTEMGGDFWKSYANTPEELWARAYHQWVADRSKSDWMRERIDDGLLKRKHPDANTVGYGHEQWTWEEFGPIADAIDDLMRSLGWMT